MTLFKKIASHCWVFGCLGLAACQLPSKDSSVIQDVLAILPGKPTKGSTQALSDERAYQEGIILRDTERGHEAAYHAGLSSLADYESFFSKLMGVEISEKVTPTIHKVLKRVFTLSKKAINTAKKRNPRIRPYAAHPGDKTCRPDLIDRTNIRNSYPSGHTGEAWSVGLILAEIYPDKANRILEAARQTGDSRWICGYHWKSDVEDARTLVEQSITRLKKEKAFIKQLEMAKREAIGM